MSDSIADELLRVVAFSSSQLRDIDLAVVADRPAPDRWSIKQVLGHLIDSACNNHQRFVRAQEAEALVFPAYDQNHWVDVQRFDDVDWDQLVDLWKNSWPTSSATCQLPLIWSLVRSDSTRPWRSTS